MNTKQSYGLPSVKYTLTNKDMKFYLINDGRRIDAKSKLEALKNAGFELIYWQGKTPYGVTSVYSNTRVYAIKDNFKFISQTI